METENNNFSTRPRSQRLHTPRASRPSPQPSPRSTGKREQGGARLNVASTSNLQNEPTALWATSPHAATAPNFGLENFTKPDRTLRPHPIRENEPTAIRAILRALHTQSAPPSTRAPKMKKRTHRIFTRN